MIKISIVIPVYNGENYIRPCLDSVLNQTLKEIEVIVINDASTDKTNEILQEYVDKYKDMVKVVQNKQNVGQGKARNIGISIASGEFITFVDSDDKIEKSMLETMYQTAIKENADLILCDYYEIIATKKEQKKLIPQRTEDIKKDYIVSAASPWCKLIKTELLTKNNLYFLETGAYEDISIIPVLSVYANKIIYIEEPLYKYYIRPGSTMRQNVFNDKLLSIYEALENIRNCFKNIEMLEPYNEEIEFIYIKHLLYAGIGRFLEYKEGREEVSKIVNIIKTRYPNWRKNKYYQRQDKLFKLNCSIFYSNCLFIIVPFRAIISKIKKHK